MFDNSFGKKKVSVSLEDRLVYLEKLGFSLNSVFSVEHLLKEFDRIVVFSDVAQMELLY